MAMINEEKILFHLEEKMKKLNEFWRITRSMVNCNLEEMAEKIAKRQVVINVIIEIDREISRLISEESFEIRRELNEILTYKNEVCSEEFSAIFAKVREIYEVLLVLSEEEVKVKAHLEKIKAEVTETAKKTVENKKIVDFYNSANVGIKNGNKFNRAT